MAKEEKQETNQEEIVEEEKPGKKKKKKKAKKLKVKIPLSPKKLAIIMAIIALVSFGYKFTIGIMALSMVMMIAAIPTFFVFLCKALYAKHMDATRAQKKKSYLFMFIFTASFSVVFVLFSILKVGGIDITPNKTFTGWIGIVFIFFIIVMFVLSIINLRGALNKDDLVVIGIKEITFVSALTDAMMIYEFLYRVLLAYILQYIPIPFFDELSRFLPLGIGVLMIFVPVKMLIRYVKYET